MSPQPYAHNQGQRTADAQSMLRMVFFTNPCSRGQLSTRCARHTRSRRSELHHRLSRRVHALIDPLLPLLEELVERTLVRSHFAGRLGRMLPDPFIAARSAARAAAGTGAGALHGGLILSSCAWIAAAFRLRACPRGASSPRQRCLAPPRHSPLPAHRRRRCAARTSRAALDGIEPDLARDPACTPKSEVTR